MNNQKHRRVNIINKPRPTANGGGTVVGHSTADCEIESSYPAPVGHQEKIERIKTISVLASSKTYH